MNLHQLIMLGCVALAASQIVDRDYCFSEVGFLPFSKSVYQSMLRSSVSSSNSETGSAGTGADQYYC